MSPENDLGLNENEVGGWIPGFVYKLYYKVKSNCFESGGWIPGFVYSTT